MEQKRRTNAFVGSPVERIEDLRFLKGRGQYVDDLTREHLLHAVMLRSSVAHGRNRSVDASAALALAGVVAVITAADIGEAIPTIPLRQEPLPALRHYQQPVIAHGKVRYVGEPIALVLAESADLYRRGDPDHSAAPRAAAGAAALPAAGHCARQGPLRRRADRARAGGERRSISARRSRPFRCAKSRCRRCGITSSRSLRTARSVTSASRSRSCWRRAPRLPRTPWRRSASISSRSRRSPTAPPP